MTNDAPLVGRDIPWSTVEGQLCKVIVFVPISTIESGKIKEPAMKLAYGGVTVEVMGFESRNIPKQIVLPVLHRLDFRNLWYLYEERGVGPQEEVLISYDPLKRKKIIGLFHRSLPSLPIKVYRCGSIQLIYDWSTGKREYPYCEPILELDARPEELQ